ncbi:dihydrolipoamide acetyltransferase family protein [Auritidibacter ignavus]|uniref:dihydrolipoamide acetyltransferase family protein n=1 Tax=Auritidibacter ignavus TaxID=678932 RepID=UPI00244C38BF|nr:dihydrolipoamide acetyltransferase family protein [Auritidibacter ignavus]WGH90483.1 dihydrolipoamide acetyltransferase family protein [Auritidibacter ignavus]
MEIFKLPDVGEGLTEADIVEWRVAVGDTVAVNDVLVEIETAKSLVELPSPFAGTIHKLFAEVGDTVLVGEDLIGIGDSATAGDESESNGDSAVAADKPLVGSGPKNEATRRRARKKPATPAHPSTASQKPDPAPESAPEQAPSPTPATTVVLAKPPVRYFAKTQGVDLAQVTPTGPRGDVTRADVEGFLNQSTPAGATATSGRTRAQAQATDPRAIVARTPVKGVRKATANAVMQSYSQAPHVSVFKDVDITRSMEFLAQLKASPSWEGIKVSPMILAIRAMVRAATIYPQFNSLWESGTADGQPDEIVQYQHVNVAVAAATPRGLIVPVIPQADLLSLKDTARAMMELTSRAREGKTQPAELAGGTVSITNFGSLGLDAGTPILTPGHTAIVGLGKGSKKPWVVDDQIVPRTVLTLGGSFDHRVVDGAEIATYLGEIAAVLAEPAVLLDE